jgi:flagellar motility protein MotE (MotC chaperone)
MNSQLKESNLTCKPYNHYGTMDSCKAEQFIKYRKVTSTIMKRKGIWLSLVFLASVLVIPASYSNVQAENEHNSTASVNASASEHDNVGEQISDFVHKAIAHFKQQRENTHNAIKECREKIKDATADTKSQVAAECHKKLQSLREKYKEERKQFQELFKKFRESIITLRNHANGTKSSDNDTDMAIKRINEDAAKNGLGGLENALKHLKGMGLVHGKIGVEHAIQEVNKTRGAESASSAKASTSTPPFGSHEGNDHGMPGKEKH